MRCCAVLSVWRYNWVGLMAYGLDAGLEGDQDEKRYRSEGMISNK